MLIDSGIAGGGGVTLFITFNLLFRQKRGTFAAPIINCVPHNGEIPDN
jgi:hypothetical protein